MQPATIDPTLGQFTSNPLRLGGPRQCGIQSLPDTSTHGKHFESNPRPSDLESNALSTGPHAPSNATDADTCIVLFNDTWSKNKSPEENATPHVRDSSTTFTTNLLVVL